MGLIKQSWTLTSKNLLIVLKRHWLSTTIRAFLAPIIFMFFISYAKNFFIPPSDYGIGAPVPVRTLANALDASIDSRTLVAFVNSGFTDGPIAEIIESLSQQVRDAGKEARTVENARQLLEACPSSLRGASNCYAGVTFHSSPSQGPGGYWNYTLHGDGALGERVYVQESDNEAEIYILPFQRAIDLEIAARDGQTIPQPDEYLYTSRNNEERDARITELYQDTLIDILALAYFIGIVGVCYQLVGQMATERELGISQLIEAMMPNKRRWQPQVARIFSMHLSFSMIYVLGWIIMGAIVARLVFPESRTGILIVFHLLAGLSLTSYSIFIGSFFRKAQLSGITAVLLSLILAVIAQLGTGADASTGTVGVLTLLFPPMTYTYFIIYCASFQQLTRGVNLSEYAPNRPWEVNGGTLWGFLIIQLLVFPILGGIIERVLYGTASTDRKVMYRDTDSPYSVQLTKFSKTFRPGWFKRLFMSCGRKKDSGVVRAVQELTLGIGRGQIMILLGANGSGKSTTLDAICGMSKITSGEIELDGRGGIGLCPQKNVLWDELTVYEHVKIFNRLKATDGRDSRSETEELIRACDLDRKLHAKSKTLSGGQKRKLQLAMMFTGGSRVCCVDEVSSGIDPLARRKVWDILLAERGQRTIILTTHFLDEADVLSDHIAIMSKGTLRAEGSAVELKNRLGSGYRVFIEDKYDWTPDASLGDVQRYHDYDQTVYQFESPSETARCIAHLESVNIEYRVQGPTVEDVFLKLAEEIKDDFAVAGDASPRSMDSDRKTMLAEVAPIDKQHPINLLDGKGTGLFAQAWFLFRKRLNVLKHNYLPYIVLVLLPIITAGLVTLFLDGQDQLSCDPTTQSSIEDLFEFASLVSPLVVAGPSEVVPRDVLQAQYPTLNATSLQIVNTTDQFNDFVRENYRNVTPGGFFAGPDGTPLFAFKADSYNVGLAVVVQNALNRLLSGSDITAGYQPFAVPFAPNAGDTLQVILYFGLAMCAFTGFFALYPTAERLRKVRALHYSNGVRSGPLWVAYAAFDFIFVLIVSIVAIALLVGSWDGWYYPGYLFVVFFLFGLTSIAYAYVISLLVSSQLAAFAFTAGSQASLFLIYFIAYLCIITYAPVSKVDDWVTIAHFTIALVTPAGNLLRALLLTLNEFSLLCDGTAVRSYGGDIMVMGGPILYLLVQFLLLMAFLIWWDSGGRIVWFRRAAKKTDDYELSETRDPEVFEELSRIRTGNDGLRALHLNKAFNTELVVDDITFGIKQGETFALLGPNGAGKSTTISLIRGDLRPSFNQSEVYVDGNLLNKHRDAARNSMGVTPQFDAMDQMTVINHLRFYARVRGVTDVEHNVREVMRAVGIQVYANRMADKLSGGNKRKLSLAIALMGNPAVLLLDEPSSGMDAAAKRVMWRVLGSITKGRALLITTHSMEEADALAQRAGIMAKRMLALGTTETLRRRHGNAYHVHIIHKDAPHTSDGAMSRIKSWVRRAIPHAIIEDRTYHGQLRFSVPIGATGSRDAPSYPSPTMSYETEKSGTMAIPYPMSPYAREREDENVLERIHSGGVSALFRLLESKKEQLGLAHYAVQPTTLDQVFLNVVRKHNIAEENYAHNHSDTKPGFGRRFGAWFRRVMDDA